MLNNHELSLLAKKFEISESKLAQIESFLCSRLDSDNSGEMLINKLKHAHESLAQASCFVEGQLVVWKRYLKNRSYPNYGEPAIVVEVLDNPIFDTTLNSGSAYFMEPLNLRLGVFDEFGDFETYLYDARRFEAYSEPYERLNKLILNESDVS